MTSTALTSLAILKINWDYRGIDYIENFVPIIVECARISPDEVISVPQMHKLVTKHFGLNLPHHALRLIISRARKRGYFRRDSHVLYKVREKCDRLDFSLTKTKVETTYDTVLTRLRAYAHTHHGVSWSTSDSETAVSDFIDDDSLTLLFNIGGRTRQNPRSRSSQFIVASFVDYSRKSDPDLLRNIELLAQGQYFANALYLPHASGIKKRFRNTSLYLDTTFLMYATGFAGRHRAEPCLELLELIGQYGADLKCFSGTLNEIHGILDACAARLKTGQLRYAYGPTIEYFVETRKTASDLELMVARLPGQLKRLGVKVVDLPPFDNYDHQVDESELEALLEHRIKYKNPRAKVHDTNCISAIARIRQGRRVRDVEDCRALFVTTNSLLVEATRQYYDTDEAGASVAFAITDNALANLLWLKNPTAAPILPRKRLIADAYAAMQPSEDLWNRYLREIQSLKETDKVTTEDYMLLRYSLTAKSALMGLTLGEKSAFTQGTIPEILEHAKEMVRADLSAAVDTEKNARITAEETLRDRDETSFAQRRRLRRLCRSIARIVSYALFVPISIVLVYGVWLTFPMSSPLHQESWLSYVTFIALLGVFLLVLGNLFFGTTVRAIYFRLEDFLAERIVSWLSKAIGYSDQYDSEQ